MIIPLTEKQKAIIVGNVLGDGGIYDQRRPNGKSSSFYIKQSARYKEYIFWLFGELENICLSAPKEKSNGQWYFYSKYLDNLTDLRETFYRKRVKVVPRNIKQLMTSPLTLAVWYMDDGSLDYRPKDHYNFALSTNAFTIDENKLLVKALKENFGIESSIQTPLCRGVRYPEIYIGVAGRDKFIELVKPYVLNCFAHKIPPHV